MTDTAPAPVQKAKKASKPKKPADHPKYSEMIAAAIKSLKERNGSSRQAILKYIQTHYKVGDGANIHVKVALKSGVNNGTLKQSKGTGASGSFKIGEKSKPAKKAAKPKAAKPKKAKSPKKKAAKKVAKKTGDKPKKPKAAKKPAAKKARTPKKAGSKPKKAAKSPKKAKAAKPKAKKTPKKTDKK